jgi:UDP-glucose 4-epimerase
MRILVTGGAGFIGSHLTEALVKRGHRVRVLDDFSSGSRRNLRAVRDDVEIHEGDCADSVAARRAVKGIELVYHEAAVASVTRSVEDPLLSHRANAGATVCVLAAARDAGVRRVIYAGSSSVYGDRAGRAKNEMMEPQPLSPYAAAKLSGEQFLRVFARLYGMETLTLRYFNVFGPRQNAGSPYSGVISLFVTALLRGRTPVIHGDGLQSRDFTFVDNVVDANLRALDARGLCGQAVNVATGRAVNLKQLLRAVARETGRPARARHKPRRPGDVRHSLADVRRARALLGYRPLVTFEAGLRLTVEWYRRQRKT